MDHTVRIDGTEHTVLAVQLEGDTKVTWVSSQVKQSAMELGTTTLCAVRPNLTC